MSDPPKELKDALGALFLDPSQPKDKYEFWETQPVAQFSEDADSENVRLFCAEKTSFFRRIMPMHGNDGRAEH